MTNITLIKVYNYTIQISMTLQLTLDAVNMDNDNWVFGCKATSVYKRTRVCNSGDNLSSKSFIMPSNGKRKTITVDMEEMR